jgi:hypothetical protein
MQIEIPADAQVQIIVGRVRPAIGEGGLPMVVEREAPASSDAGRGGRRLLKGTIAVLLLASSFAAGDYFGKAPNTLHLADAVTASAAPRPAVPDDLSTPTAAARVPPAFRRQLEERPAVIPPPGPATAAPGKNPFGLEN